MNARITPQSNKKYYEGYDQLFGGKNEVSYSRLDTCKKNVNPNDYEMIVHTLDLVAKENKDIRKKLETAIGLLKSIEAMHLYWAFDQVTFKKSIEELES